MERVRRDRREMGVLVHREKVERRREVGGFMGAGMVVCICKDEERVEKLFTLVSYVGHRLIAT